MKDDLKQWKSWPGNLEENSTQYSPQNQRSSNKNNKKNKLCKVQGAFETFFETLYANKAGNSIAEMV